MNLGFSEVTRYSPCPICGRPDWCSVSSDGNVICCRREYGGIERLDISGTPYFLYFEDGWDSSSTRFRYPETKEIAKADPNTLHDVYTLLLNNFSLLSKHKDNLLQRGLPEDEIIRRGYGSLPEKKRWKKVQAIIQKFGETVCASVPGLIVQDGEYGRYWTVSGMPGILIPVRDLQGRILAMKVRLDQEDDSGKYRYLSSKSKGGPGPGSHVHVPLNHGIQVDTVRITEGELKADIATRLDQTLTLSIPGVSMWRMAFPILKQINPKIVIIAFDEDSKTNITVAKNLENFARAIRGHNYELRIEE